MKSYLKGLLNLFTNLDIDDNYGFNSIYISSIDLH